MYNVLSVKVLVLVGRRRSTQNTVKTFEVDSSTEKRMVATGACWANSVLVFTLIRLGESPTFKFGHFIVFRLLKGKYSHN